MNANTIAGLNDALSAICGADGVVTEAAELDYYAQDLFSSGMLPLAIVCPASVVAMAALVQLARKQGIALFARGGGMSYTKAFQPTRAPALIIDFSRLSRIREIAVADGHVTVEAGCTWAALDAALLPHGMRARWWGPMSGGTATIGGSLSQGSVTFGSGTTGASANAVKSFEIVSGTGEVLRTGSDGSTGTGPFNRNFGPDLTGLFANDAGALGIKTAVTLEIEPRPAKVSGLTFAVHDFDRLAELFHAVLARRLASEVIAMDGDVARQNAGPASAVEDTRAMWRIGKAAGNPVTALLRMARIAAGGRRFIDKALYTAHFVVEGRDAAALNSRIAAIRTLAADCDEIVNTVPLMTRANPFPVLPVTHPDGRRMLPIHGMFTPVRAKAFHREYLALKAVQSLRLAEAQVTIAEFFAGVAGIGILYEPVFYWPDALTEYHQRLTPGYLAGMPRYPANRQARALVEELTQTIIALMRKHGSTHFQIGRLYPQASTRADGLLPTLKAALDPDDIINPGALGL